MAATNVQIVDSTLNPATTPSIVYTSPASGDGTRITQCTVKNTGVSTVAYNIYVVSNALTATDQNAIASHQLIAGETDSPLEALNVFIPNGGTLQVDADVISTVSFRVSGLEFTS